MFFLARGQPSPWAAQDCVLLPLAAPYHHRVISLYHPVSAKEIAPWVLPHFLGSLFGVWKENWGTKGDYSTVWRHTFHCLPHTAVLHNTVWTGTVHYSWGTEQFCTTMYLHGTNQNTDQPILNVLSLENPPSRRLLCCYGTKLEEVFISTEESTYDGASNRRKRHSISCRDPAPDQKWTGRMYCREFLCTASGIIRSKV